MQTRDVEYKHGPDLLEGFLAFDDNKAGRRPGILLFPEWYGVAHHAKARAKMLAELGYVAFAADMYGKGVRPTEFDDCAGLDPTWRGRSDRAGSRSARL